MDGWSSKRSEPAAPEIHLTVSTFLDILQHATHYTMPCHITSNDHSSLKDIGTYHVGPATPYHTIMTWGLLKNMVPQNCSYAMLSRPFHAPAELGHGIMITFSCAYFVYIDINSGIQTFREPFATLSRPFATAAKTCVHICRCHSDTKKSCMRFRTTPT